MKEILKVSLKTVHILKKTLLFKSLQLIYAPNL